MKTAALRESGTVAITEAARPEPGPGEALIRVEAWLVNEGPSPLDWTGGVGRVEALGADVDGLAVGTRVVPPAMAPCSACAACARGMTAQCEAPARLVGTPSELVVLPAHLVATGLCPVPETVDPVAAALAEPLARVLKGQDRTPARRGEAAIVLGLGVAGLLWTRVLTLAGARVTAVDARPSHLDAARALGAVEAEVDVATDGDLVVETRGDLPSLQRALAAVRSGGRVHLAGTPLPDTTLGLDVAAFQRREILLASSTGHTPYHITEAVRLVVGGLLDPTQIVSSRIGLDEFPAFLERRAHDADVGAGVIVFER